MSKPADVEPLPFPVLIADIGGTNTRFAIVADRHAALTVFPTVHTTDFASIGDAIRATASATNRVRPRSAVFALAGPIQSDTVPLTNCDWVVEPARLIGEFALDELVLLNDFEALALALPSLGPSDLAPIGSGAMREGGAKLVVGPGTGLGAAGLISIGDLHVPISGEGGHVTLAPQTERDAAVFAHLERMGGGQRVSAEWVLSGPGLVRLYRAIAATDRAEPRLVLPQEISAAGLAGSDPNAADALHLFATYLGRVAGDLALIFMATGGIYLAGGVARLLAAFLKTSGFRAAFDDKWPHRALMESMATVVITHRSPALTGIAEFVRAPSRFGLALTGRRWRGRGV